MGGKACKCCGCLRDGGDDVPYFIDANAPISRPRSKKKAKAEAKEREKEKEEYRISKSRTQKPKLNLKSRLLRKKDDRGKGKAQRGDSWKQRPSGQVQYSQIPDRDSEDLNSEDFSLVNSIMFVCLCVCVCLSECQYLLLTIFLCSVDWCLFMAVFIVVSG